MLSEPAPSTGATTDRVPTALRVHPHDGPIVYYLASTYGGVLKIGTTVDLPNRTARLMRLQPMLVPVLLAWEPGDQHTERDRHRQFAASRLNRDWFWQTAEVMAHVNYLRRR